MHRKGPYRPWWLLLYKIESPFVNEMSYNLKLHVISSAVECYIKIYSNVVYRCFGPHTLWGLHLCKLVSTYHKDISCQLQLQEVFEDTKGVIRIRKSTQWPNKNGQQDTQQSTKHTHKTKDRVTEHNLKPGWTRVLQKGIKQFLLHIFISSSWEFYFF